MIDIADQFRSPYLTLKQFNMSVLGEKTKQNKTKAVEESARYRLFLQPFCSLVILGYCLFSIMMWVVQVFRLWVAKRGCNGTF